MIVYARGKHEGQRGIAASRGMPQVEREGQTIFGWFGLLPLTCSVPYLSSRVKGGVPHPFCLLAAGETMALDAAGRAAHEGVLQATFRRHKLPAALRAAIADFFVAKGWSVVDVPWDVDASDEAGWEAEWRAFLEDAGVNRRQSC